MSLLSFSQRLRWPSSLIRALIWSLVLHGAMIFAPRLPLWRESARPLSVSLLPVPPSPRQAAALAGAAMPLLSQPGLGSRAPLGGRATGQEQALSPALEGARLEQAVEGEGLRRYRMALGLAMAPASPELGALKELGAGRVDMVLELRRGQPPVVRLEKGSNSAALDQAALNTVEAAARRTPRPAALAEGDYGVPVTLLFGDGD